MSEILKYSGEWKDFFWIIFTLSATITSSLTYLHVRKSMRQPLYNKIVETQIEAYTSILEMLKESCGTFLLSCDVENMLKYNLIGHLVDFGIMEEYEIMVDIHNSYKIQLEGGGFMDGLLEEKLNSVESMTINVRQDMEQEQQTATEKEGKYKKRKLKHFKVPGKFILENIRGAIMCTPKVTEINDQLGGACCNIYMPKKILKGLKKFEKAYLDIMLRAIPIVIKREEDRIFHGKQGDTIELDFSHLFNDVMEKSGKIAKPYNLLKRELRKALMIDARW